MISRNLTWLIASILLGTVCVKASGGEFLTPDDFMEQPAFKKAKPQFSLELEPLRTAFWWAYAAYEEPADPSSINDPFNNEEVEFPTLSPIPILTILAKENISISAAYLLDFEFQGGWGVGLGFGVHEIDTGLRGKYWGGKAYFLNQAEYGNTFRVFGEAGKRFLLLENICGTLGAALGYGNNGVNTRDGATYGLVVELQARLGYWK